MPNLCVAVRVRQGLTLASGLLECLCFCGLMFGWASLVFVLKVEGFFGSLCVNATGENDTLVQDCSEQDGQLSLIFTIASFVNSFATLPTGFLYDYFGTMVARLIAISFHTFGTLLFAFSSPDLAVLIYPALSMLAFGGVTLLITNMQVGNLLGSHRSTIITLYNGAFGSSSAIFLFIKLIYESGISLRASFFFLSACSVIHVLRTLFLMPRKFIPYPLPDNFTYGISCKKTVATEPKEENNNTQVKDEEKDKEKNEDEEKDTEKEKVQDEERNEENENKVEEKDKKKDEEKNEENEETVEEKDNKEDEKNDEEKNKQEDEEKNEENEETVEQKDVEMSISPEVAVKTEKTLRECVLSWFFLWHLLWLSVMMLRHYFFIGTLNPMLQHLTGGDPTQVSQYTNAFAITQLCAVLCAPWNGLILDRHKGKPRAEGESERDADLKATVLSLFLTALQCLLFSICATIPVLQLQYFTFVLQVINRSFLFGGFVAFVSVAFPPCHFGKVYGIMMSLAALFSLLQYLCFTLVQDFLDGDPLYVNIALTVLILVAFLHPAYVFLHCRRRAKERESLSPA